MQMNRAMEGVKEYACRIGGSAIASIAAAAAEEEATLRTIASITSRSAFSLEGPLIKSFVLVIACRWPRTWVELRHFRQGWARALCLNNFSVSCTTVVQGCE